MFRLDAISLGIINIQINKHRICFKYEKIELIPPFFPNIICYKASKYAFIISKLFYKHTKKC